MNERQEMKAIAGRSSGRQRTIEMIDDRRALLKILALGRSLSTKETKRRQRRPLLLSEPW